MRRHYLYASQASETSVGDAKRSVLGVWLARRVQLLYDDNGEVARLLALFWTLAKPARDVALAQRHYVAFFQCVAKALVQSVGNDHAAGVAARDWLYDCAGGGKVVAHEEEELATATLSLAQFHEALLQCAELVLPVESDAAAFAAFFTGLRDAVASPPSPPSSSALWRLRALRDVATIRGGWLQKMPPNAEHLALVCGLASPDMERMSLKQLLLAYNPRKLSLSRAFSSLGAAASSASTALSRTPDVASSITEGEDEEEEKETAANVVTSSSSSSSSSCSSVATTPPLPCGRLSRESDDAFDAEQAAVRAIEDFPALRLAVVGPPGAGKSRVAASLAARLSLQYVSVPLALADAVASKRARDAEREARRHRRREEEHANEAEAATARAAEQEEAGVDGEATGEPLVPPTRAVLDEEETGIEETEADALFGSGDLAALLRGEALPRDRALPILIAFARRTLLRGVGVVLDDVFAHEVAAALALDAVVTLEMAREDAQQHAAGFTLAPTSRRMYSARERAMLSECDAALRERGLVDTTGFQQSGGGEEEEHDGDDASEPQRRARVAEVMAAAAAAAVALRAKPPAEGEAGEEGEEKPVEEEEKVEVQEESAEMTEKTTRTKRVVSPAERNQVVAPDEPTLPLRQLQLDAFSDRYRHFEARAAMAAAADETATQVVRVLAAQALHDVVAQCVAAVTNNALGLSRSAASRAVLPLPLPEEIAGLESRADQLRWLLYGDWSGYLPTLAAVSFAHGPATPSAPRLLSRWRDCCVVTSSSSSSSSLVAGDPQFAALFGGRVYLFASAAARVAFAAAPLQFLRREPPSLAPPATRRLWVVACCSLDDATAHALARLVDGDHVSATARLAADHSLRHVMALGQGEPLAPAAVAAVVADELQTKQAWVLTDLVPTREAVDVLREKGCLPDAVVVLSVGEADRPRVYTTPLDRKRHELWTAQYDDAETLAGALAGVEPPLAVRRSALFVDALETQAALWRVLSPVAPRVDAEEDGTARDAVAAEDEHALVFAPQGSESAMEEADGSGRGAAEAEAEVEEAEPKEEEDTRGYDAAQLVRLAKRRRMGEVAQFCAVTWAAKRVLVPGQPPFVASFRQKLYAFAGASELEAFTRNPTAYVPSQARATRGVVPVVWLLGVRGCDVARAAAGVASSAVGRIGVVDDAAVAARVSRRLRAQLLMPAEKQATVSDVYVDELAREVQGMEASGAWDAVVVASVTVAGIVLPAPLEGERGQANAAVGTSPPLPTPELLALCFQRDLFPSLVLSLDASEDGVIQRQLTAWRAALPPVRSARKTAPSEGGDAGAPADEAAAVDPAELEAAETVRLQEQFQSDQEALTLALETLRARGLAVAKGVHADTTSRAVVKALGESIATLRRRKDSLFENCERVSAAHAQRLLASGEAVVGKHAALCPVTGSARPAESSEVPALVYRGRLYFPATQAALAQCALAPAASMAEPVSRPPQCCLTCCIVGPPTGVGATTTTTTTTTARLAHQLARRFGLVYVSPRSAIDWVLQCLGPQHALWTRLTLARRAGSELLDADLVHDAVHARLRAADCQRLGWVLDAYVLAAAQLARCLDETKQPVHPGVVFLVEGEAAHQHEPDEHRLAAWQAHRLDLIHAWTSAFGAFHLRQLDADASSAWQLLAQASEGLAQLGAALRGYARDVAMQRAARLHGVVKPQHTLATMAHAVYGAFCPVELAAGRYHASLASHRELCVEWDGRMLWLASEANARAFCAAPAAFITADALAHAQQLVATAPVDASLLSLLSVADCAFPEMKGYCPVTFQRGTGDTDWQALTKGDVFFRVSFGNQVFCCLSERARRAFVAEPTKFAALALPTKLPPQLAAPLAAKNCPGRIEQELSGVLNETLLLLGAARPKFLGVDTRASACVFLALLLKTKATSGAVPAHVRAKYGERLRRFERDCRLGEQLQRAISPSATTSRGTAIKGVRAVRELSASAAEAEMPPALGREDDDAAWSVEAMRERFDELARCVRPTGSANQRASSPRSNDQFLAYAEPLTKP